MCHMELKGKTFCLKSTIVHLRPVSGHWGGLLPQCFRSTFSFNQLWGPGRSVSSRETVALLRAVGKMESTSEVAKGKEEAENTPGTCLRDGGTNI